MKNIVEAPWLYENLDRVIVIDATNNFMDPEEGRQKYQERHIEGAFHMDLREDMCGELMLHGGRDPLPQSMDHFKNKLESFGVSTDSVMIAYDEDMVPSSRFWWMCKYIGLDKVKVLNGGINAWIKAGYPLTGQVAPLPKAKGHIEMDIQHDLYADIKDIKTVGLDKSKKIAIIDSRTQERYKGIVEPIDKIAGHIPESLNYYYGDVLDSEAKYKDIDFLKDHYKDLSQYDELVVHCGSGVSGSVNIIAMDEIGLKAKFYVGSWSDYITYDDSIIIVEK